MKRGPKGLFTPQLQKEICESVEQGNTFKTACEARGIGERTLYDWIEALSRVCRSDLSRAISCKGKTCSRHREASASRLESSGVDFGTLVTK